MCTLSLTESIDEQLEPQPDAPELGFIEKNLVSVAEAASVEVAGVLDAPSKYLHHPFAKDLRNRGVRHHRIAGHRIYYRGAHTDCNYVAFYIKWNKDEGDWSQDDDNPAFHKRLRKIVDSPVARILPPPVEANEIPDYQKKEWWINSQQYAAEADPEGSIED